MKDKKEAPGYLVVTPIDELLDDGLQFDGETEKDRIINQFDFVNTRDILQRFSTGLTKDNGETLTRYLKLCVKSETA